MYRRASLLVLCSLLFACTPGAVRYRTLLPQPSEGAYTLRELLPYIPGSDTLQIDAVAAANVVVVVGDSAILAFSLYEFPDVLYFDFYIFNGTSAPMTLSPGLVSLVDDSKNQLRRLEPHEAANVFLAHTRGVPPYQPKYNYYVSTYTYGNYSYSQVTAEQDPGTALGYAIGAAILRHQNQKLTEMANVVYATGLVDGTQVEADAGIRGSVCWLNTLSKAYPLRLRIPALELEVLFRSDR